MFRARWSWVAPLVLAAAVFAGVLLATPPGFLAISEVLLGQPRGANADAAAYALGAAATLALLALLAAALVLGALDLLSHRRR